jgi:CRISPR-associated protein (TIGR03986 family)
MIEGTLIWNGKSLQVRYKSKKGKDTTVNPKQQALSRLIRQKLEENPADLHEQAVEIGIGTDGQPSQICFKGENEIQAEVKEIGDFHNPYNFIPALPRQGKVTETELGDHSPVGHHAYLPDYWSGTIAVKLTTKTPLIVHDAAKVKIQDEHKIFPTRCGVDNRPYLAPTSIKGMLRSAYEIVTNSRLSIFASHGDCLAYRNPPSPSKKKDQNRPRLIPAIVESVTDGSLSLKLLKYNKLENYGYTVRLPCYSIQSFSKEGSTIEPLCYENSRILPVHGEKVWVTHNAQGIAQEIHPWQERTPDNQQEWKVGWVCATGQNINGKKFERVFIKENGNRQIPITDEHKHMWKQLICNYKKANERNLKKREKSPQSYDAYLGFKPGEPAFSRHLWEENSEELKPKTLCYVTLNSQGEIIAMAPVIISRQLYSVPPDSLLDQSLKPASALQDLSPADRVFGWVNQSGSGACKGHLRVNPVQCESNNAIEKLDPPVPLAILSSPKPEQARFYVAQNDQGTTLSDQLSKAEGYSAQQAIRGRKVYPHHKDGLKWQEWIRTNQEKDDQNCSIESWVKPGISFTFTLEVTNLSSVELGALLWILDLKANSDSQKDYYHRLGAGKPFGFGSVQLEIDWGNTQICQGGQWQKFYGGLNTLLTHDTDARSCIDIYKDVLSQAYGEGQAFEQVSLIQSFCQAAQGFQDNLPIHYPRLTPEKRKNETEDNPIFDWFGKNESLNQEVPGARLALPALWQEIGLPYNPVTTPVVREQAKPQSKSKKNNR